MTDATVRELAEHLARRLGANAGRRRLTLIFVDGRYVDGYAEERLQPKQLEQLQALADELRDRARGRLRDETVGFDSAGDAGA